LSFGRGLIAVWEEGDSAGGHGHKHDAANEESTAPGNGRAIFMAACSATNDAQNPLAWNAPTAIAPKADAFQTRPALAQAPDGHVYAAWHELDENGKRVVVAKLSYTD
jgi:hypothetical protein